MSERVADESLADYDSLWRIAGPAIVTGGGQGLGRAFAHAFAGNGAPVVIADSNLDAAERVVGEIAAAGGRAAALRVDVSNESSTAEMALAVVDSVGTPAVLVNNAALFSTLQLRSYDEISIEEWRRVLDVNITGAYLCVRAIGPLMAAAGYGKIINISSATIWSGRPNYLHYVTSKAALIGFTRALASELGPSGVCVNAITPGSTQTEVERATISPEDRERMAEATPLRRIQVPSDLVGAVLFLGSRASDFITGQALNVDGGVTFH
jgi:3-oxoacyl-[acyl-carrier protein] reductase